MIKNGEKNNFTKLQIVVIIYILIFLIISGCISDNKNNSNNNNNNDDEIPWGKISYKLIINVNSSGEYSIIVPIRYNVTLDYSKLISTKENITDFEIVYCNDIIDQIFGNSDIYGYGLKIYFTNNFSLNFETFSNSILTLRKDNYSVLEKAKYLLYFHSNNNLTAKISIDTNLFGSSYLYTDPKYQEIKNYWNIITISTDIIEG